MENRFKIGILRYAAILTLSLFISNMIAQESIVSVGSNATGSNGNVSYSVGQISYTTITGVSGSITQGVQQPFEISVSGIDNEKAEKSISCSTYPNPTSDYIVVEINDCPIEKLSYRLYDNAGKVLAIKALKMNRSKVPMKEYQPSVYYLKICDNHKVIKTFKIIKH